MLTLADIVDETRLNVSRALRSLQDRGLVTLTRGHITVHNII